MNRKFLLLQLFLTVAILALAPNNLLAAVLFLLLWIPLFWNRPKLEWVLFVLVNLVFVANDIAAIRNHFFQFTNPDVLELPYWEFFMWGYYLQHSHLLLQVDYPRTFQWKSLVFAIVFSMLFGVVPDRTLLLGLSSGVLLLSLIFYHEKGDLLFCFYMMLLGIIFEFVGIHQNLWSYPNQGYQASLIQFVVMWGFVGLSFRRLVGPLFSSKFYRKPSSANLS